MTSGRYSDRVRRIFSAPAHAGSLPGGQAATHAAEVALPERGGWVRYEAVVRNHRVEALRFRAWGCPHFMAACELAAEAVEGRSLAAAAGVRAADLARALDAPAEKLGRLLVIEDALQALAAGTAGAQ